MTITQRVQISSDTCGMLQQHHRWNHVKSAALVCSQSPSITDEWLNTSARTKYETCRFRQRCRITALWSRNDLGSRLPARSEIETDDTHPHQSNLRYGMSSSGTPKSGQYPNPEFSRNAGLERTIWRFTFYSKSVACSAIKGDAGLIVAKAMDSPPQHRIWRVTLSWTITGSIPSAFAPINRRRSQMLIVVPHLNRAAR